MMSTRPRLAVPLLTIFTVVATAGVSSAHDLWVTFKGGASARQVVLNYGHPGDRPPALADKVISLDVITGSDRKSLVKGMTFGMDRGAPVAVSASFNDTGRQLVAVVYDNGLWFKGADGQYRNAVRTGVPGATEGLWSRKFAKAITGPGSPFDMVLDHAIEIIPLSDPAAAAANSILRVRVLFEGKPLPNARIERSVGRHVEQFKTDADGIAAIQLRGGGDYTLSADHRRTKSAIPEFADTDLFNATYAFSLPRRSFSDWLSLLGW